MGDQIYHTGDPSGFQYQSNTNLRRNNELNESGKKRREEDKDLVIEENTVYEIDRECYERLKKQKKYKLQEKKNV
jgi:hypothetical protein